MWISEVEGLRPQNGDYGIEIEMEGFDLPVSCPNWLRIRDHSLRPDPDACEFVLKNPLSYEDSLSALDNLIEKVKNSVIKDTGRAGAHIHINCQFLSIKQIINRIILFLIFERMLLEWCGDDRADNFYCLGVHQTPVLIDWMMNIKETGKIEEVEENTHKYSCLNITSLFMYGSIEIRCLPTTSDLSKVKDWLSIIHKVFSFDVSPLPFLEQISGKGVRKVVEEVFGEYAEELMCPRYEEMVMDNLRILQPVIYTPMYVPPKTKEEWFAQNNCKWKHRKAGMDYLNVSEEVFMKNVEGIINKWWIDAEEGEEHA